VSGERIRLYWKYEDGPEDATDEDVGPAWIEYPDGRSEKVRGGEWITRLEARGLAAEAGYDLDEDDGESAAVPEPAVYADEEIPGLIAAARYGSTHKVFVYPTTEGKRFIAASLNGYIGIWDTTDTTAISPVARFPLSPDGWTSALVEAAKRNGR